MRYNKGPAFVHPVTHEVIEQGQWYEGNAHVEVENEELEAVSDVLVEDAEPQKKRTKKATDGE